MNGEPKAPVATRYAVCNTCDRELADPTAARSHVEETMTPVEGEGHIKARSHSYTVVNPTPEEVMRSRVQSAVEDAVSGFCEKMDRLVAHGKLTSEQVSAGLRGCPDFSDAWEEWLLEDES